MAIEIIKEGVSPMITKKCDCCCCEFKFDRREVERYGSNNCISHVVKCPFCDTMIGLDKQEQIKLGLFLIAENG